jgi:hypothetical protein
MRYASLLLLSLILYIPFTSAQKPKNDVTQASIYLMYAHPFGDFKDAGCAAPGMGLGFQYGKEVTSSVNWITDLAFSINWTNKSDLTKSKAKVLNSFEAPAVIAAGTDNVTVNQYVNIWAMTGVNYEYPIFNNPAYIGAQVGIMGTKMPEVSATFLGVKYDQSAAVSTALAYSFQIGYKFDKLNVGIRYWGSTPTYKVTAEAGPSRMVSTVKYNIAIVSFNIGIMI